MTWSKRGSKLRNINQGAIEDIDIDTEWNFSNQAEYLMHTIHSYPAKFPAFIAAKAFDYAEMEGVLVDSVADVFCGCGTVALEAKIHNKSFWGCDINPVATLIAKTKSESYQIQRLEKYFSEVNQVYKQTEISPELYNIANDRLKYWFTSESYLALYKLLLSIKSTIPIGKYQDAFLCLFSSTLKASSKWLTKSIKPQVDPNKQNINVLEAYSLHYRKFLQSVRELHNSVLSKDKRDIVIKTHNFLSLERLPIVDLIISSPPYVTSYEYADLHQLSTLWLGYAEDFRDIRQGSIGSVYNSEEYKLSLDKLNSVGNSIVSRLLETQKNTAKVRSIGRYYIDIQQSIHQCSKMLNLGGMAIFVVGDTEYKGVKILNSAHLLQTLSNEGFTDIKVAKRRISNKLLTPYRDSIGRFSSDKTMRKIYHEEFIISGRKA